MAAETRTLTTGKHNNRAFQTVFIFLGIIIFITLMVLIIFPSWTLIKTSLTREKAFTLNNYIELLSQKSTYTVLVNSLFVSLLGSVGATVIGVLIAWLLARTDVPGKRFWQTFLIVPYLIPPFIGAIAWVYLLGPVGYLNKIWMAISGSLAPLFVIYGKWGIVFVMAIYSYPIAYMVNLGPFRQMNPSLEEAARISGASMTRTLRDIVLPLMAPSIGGSFLLIFMSMMANFGIPAVIGFPARYYVMTTKIYMTILNYDNPNNLALSAGLSMLLVVIALVLMQVQRRVQRNKSYAIISGKSTQPQQVQLGKWRTPAVVFLSLLVFVAVIAPLLAILLTALMRALGVPLTLDNITLRNFAQVLFELPKARRAVINSLGLAAGSATIIVLVSLVISYLIVRLRVKGSQLIEGIILLPYAIPGTVVALALILAFLKPLPLLKVSIYNTIWILVVGYVTRFLTLGERSIKSALEQIHVSLEEAARISGANYFTAFKDIVLPLIKTNVFAGWFLAFIPALTELTLSILLFSVNNETLGTVVYGLHQEGKVLMTAALAFIVTIIVLGLNFITNRLTKNQMGF
ncbi:MAG: iron ABC transporter permease [Anaerolineaceae bacterium]|nr:iron ABC transporter permease [Anaerolineaceae bacterium]HNX45201.1 iron ABC transporter permease [Anaerolineaceae bacterium]HPT24565.1 iron ABC transporter permease [Anaerolineaceae bacterium]